MMTLIELEAPRTYATRENAIKAVERKFGPRMQRTDEQLRYIIYQNKEGRFFPVFIGERALQAGMHFSFNVIA